MTRVFKKLYPKNPVSLSTGKAIRFEDMNDGTGFFVTEDLSVIAEFEACMAAGRGGIEPSTKEEYDAAVKKKPTLRPFNGQLIRELQTSGLITTPLPASPVPVASVAAVADKPALAPAAPKVGKRTKA